MFDKFMKTIPYENIFLGFRIRKDTVSKTVEDESSSSYNILTLTYISDTLHVFIKENDKYYDPQLKKYIDEINVEELLTNHLDYSNKYLNITKYEQHKKEDLYGIYGLMNIDDIVETLKNTETLFDIPKIYYNKEAGLTTMAVEILQKDLNKYFNFKADYIVGPILGKDDLDPYKIHYLTKEQFLKDIENKNPIQIKEFIKQKNLTE